MQISKNKLFKDLTNKRFGRLVVSEYAGVTKPDHPDNKGHQWTCKCDCGSEKIILGYNLKSGHTQSCGCLQKEMTNKNIIDLTDKRFGRLVVLKYAGAVNSDCSRKKDHQWNCKCDCDNEVIILGDCLRGGNTQSCGCLQKDIVRARKIDLTGKKFGKLTVIEFSHKNSKKQYLWLCKCDCGNKKIINGSNLRKGKSKSCGCAQGNYIHGMTGKPGYKAFYLKDPVKKIRHNVSTAIRDALKKKGKSKGGSTFDHLPYTPQELKEHLENQFELWMSWNNYGGCNDNPDKTWQIDHIIPQVSFPYTSMEDEDFLKCWDLNNLRPLEKRQNMAKGSKLQ